MKCRIGGVEHTLWGIPGAYKVELVYNKGGASYSVNGIPYYNWAKKSEVVDPVTKDVTVTYEDNNSSGDNTYWSVSMSESSTMYVRSMTIWYTCG